MLVSLYPNTVTCAVNKKLSVSRIVDDLAGRLVDLSTWCTNRGRRYPSGLRGIQHLVKFSEPIGWRSDVNTTRYVRAVAHPIDSSHRATNVKQHRLALPDDPLPGVMMRTRSVRAGCHDCEVHPLVALLDNSSGNLGGYVSLGTPDQGHLTDLNIGQDSVYR
jgi:hypothetical protein